MNALTGDTEFALLLHEIMWVHKHFLSAIPDSNSCLLFCGACPRIPSCIQVYFFQLNSYLSVGMYHAIGLICYAYCLEHHHGIAVVIFVFNDGENARNMLTMRIVSMDKCR